MADKVKLPTREEIKQLPRWARVAFAARCARRVLPLVKHFWKCAPEHYLKALDKAVSAAETVAGRTATYLDVYTSAAVVTAAVAAAAAAADARVVGAAAANAAGAAAANAARAARAPTADDDAPGAAARATAYAAAYTYPEAACVAYVVATEKAIRADFECLLLRARDENWTDDTPVPPTVFGSMWPDGPPPRWPKEETGPEPEPTPAVVDESNRVILRVEIPDVNSQQHVNEIENGVNELINALNEAHIARGAGRLTIDDIKHLISALVKEGV
jgi:hypothetical protein